MKIKKIITVFLTAMILLSSVWFNQFNLFTVKTAAAGSKGMATTDTTFGFEDKYTIETTTGSTKEFKMGKAYLNYDSNELGVEIVNENNNSYLKVTRIKNNAPVPLRTPLKLEKNTYYKISYKYKLGKRSFLNNTPTFTACREENHWGHYLVNLNQSRPCSIMGTTMAGDGFSYSDQKSMVLKATDDWMIYSEIVYTDRIIGGAANDQDMLGIYFKVGYDFTDMCLDDFTVEKISNEILTPDSKLYDFNDKFESYIYRSNPDFCFYVDRDKGCLSISENDTYKTASITFDYKLESKTEYEIRMCYSIRKCAIRNNEEKIDPFGFYAFDYYNNGVYDCTRRSTLVELGIHNTGGKFVERTERFTTGDFRGKEKWLTFATETYWGIGMDIDWLLIKKVGTGDEDPDKELILNGDFENGKTGWSQTEAIATVADSGCNSASSMRIGGGYFDFLSQPVMLEQNKNYELSFDYKGKSSGIYNWSVSHDRATLEDAYSYAKGDIGDSDVWSKQSIVFNTGSSSLVYVSFISDYSCDFYIDNVSLKATDKESTVDQSEKTPAHIGSMYTTTFLDRYGVHCVAYVCKDEDNLINDPSFENGNGVWKNMLGSGYMESINDNTAKHGQKVVKFEAYNADRNDTWSTFFVNVKPNTEYYFAAVVKGEQWSEKNKCDMYLGFVDPSTGKFITNSGVKADREDRQLSFCYDNEWHIVRNEITTGSETKIGIGFSGENTTAYIDQMWLFEKGDEIEYKFVERDKKDITVIDESPDLLSCNDRDNLLSDADFDGFSDSFWKSNALGYEITASIDSTESTKKNALHYVENTYGTGRPKGTFYIKWIDVEPNTEYTFAADLCIIKEGGGWFGVINGSKYLPYAVSKYSFYKENNFDYDRKWNTVGVTFNTEEYDRIGIAMCDSGGEAFVDNMTLCLSSKATKRNTSTGFPTKLKSSTYPVKDSFVVIKDLNKSLNSVITKFENNKYINPVLNDGLINDKGSAVTTGVDICLMDGVTVNDRATLILLGDINKDGNRNLTDLDSLLEYLVKNAEYDKNQSKASDCDQNGKIDINDAVWLSENRK